MGWALGESRVAAGSRGKWTWWVSVGHGRSCEETKPSAQPNPISILPQSRSRLLSSSRPRCRSSLQRAAAGFLSGERRDGADRAPGDVGGEGERVPGRLRRRARAWRRRQPSPLRREEDAAINEHDEDARIDERGEDGPGHRRAHGGRAPPVCCSLLLVASSSPPAASVPSLRYMASSPDVLLHLPCFLCTTLHAAETLHCTISALVLRFCNMGWRQRQHQPLVISFLLPTGSNNSSRSPGSPMKSGSSEIYVSIWKPCRSRMKLVRPLFL